MFRRDKFSVEKVVIVLSTRRLEISRQNLWGQYFSKRLDNYTPDIVGYISSIFFAKFMRITVFRIVGTKGFGLGNVKNKMIKNEGSSKKEDTLEQA